MSPSFHLSTRSGCGVVQEMVPVSPRCSSLSSSSSSSSWTFLSYAESPSPSRQCLRRLDSMLPVLSTPHRLQFSPRSSGLLVSLSSDGGRQLETCQASSQGCVAAHASLRGLSPHSPLLSRGSFISSKKRRHFSSHAMHGEGAEKETAKETVGMDGAEVHERDGAREADEKNPEATIGSPISRLEASGTVVETHKKVGQAQDRSSSLKGNLDGRENNEGGGTGATRRGKGERRGRGSEGEQKWSLDAFAAFLTPREKGDFMDVTLMSLTFAVLIYISQRLVCAYCAFQFEPKSYF
eukprot:TRINITY_DN481_c0_g5_i1.p1 TRINITY_DN481_c0_g5~~TRINITY_DN481_c0_g5_i1.p1  ORF type:complete len:295 (+),score=47.37 TRINITY_DN481_c0_g5_i1:394-1278(+)